MDKTIKEKVTEDSIEICNNMLGTVTPKDKLLIDGVINLVLDEVRCMTINLEEELGECSKAVFYSEALDELREKLK